MSIDPVIISSYEPGLNNVDLEKTISRLDAEVMWRDLPSIMITPAGQKIESKVWTAWENMMVPPNNRFVRLTAIGVEVGAAYSRCLEGILSHPELSTWKYIVTREHDNVMPPDGLIKLLRTMERNPEYGGIGGLYFTKGKDAAGLPTGCAQIWGDVSDPILNFRPQKPDPNGGLKPCYGIGMGFSIFRLEMFKDRRLRKPWFKTLTGETGEGMATQDMYFATDAFKHGYKFAVDCGVKVGHWDDKEQVMY